MWILGAGETRTALAGSRVSPHPVFFNLSDVKLRQSQPILFLLSQSAGTTRLIQDSQHIKKEAGSHGYIRKILTSFFLTKGHYKNAISSLSS